MAHLFEIVRELDPQLRNLIAFIEIEERDGELHVQFDFALSNPETELRPATRLDAVRLTAGRTDIPRALQWQRMPPILATAALDVPVAAQIDELNHNLILGMVTGLQTPLASARGRRWRLATHSGSLEEREAWMRGIPYRTLADAALLLGIAPDEVLSNIRDGLLPAEARGDGWLIDLSQAAQTNTPLSPPPPPISDE
jgi:hypothetical protein